MTAEAGSMADKARADALIHEIGNMIVRDANYRDRDWTAIALVIEVAARKRMYGFLYTADDWEAETPEEFDVITKAQELQAAMGSGWTACLVRITRPGPKVTIDFDYGASGKWTVTPANHAEMVETLRPA